MAVLVVFVYLFFLAVTFVNRRSEEKRRMLAIVEHTQQLNDMNQKLREEILQKEAELACSSEFLIKDDQVFQEIEKKLYGLKKKLGDGSVREIDEVLVSLKEQMLNQFEVNASQQDFNSVQSDFFKKLKSDFPDLTNSDLKLASYLRMNLSTKEIAQLLNISSRSLDNKRYFLRKKLKLAPGANLIEFIIVNY